MMRVGDLVEIQTSDENYNGSIAVIVSVTQQRAEQWPHRVGSVWDVFLNGDIISFEDWEIKDAFC
jgi:hypothetical protein